MDRQAIRESRGREVDEYLPLGYLAEPCSIDIGDGNPAPENLPLKQSVLRWDFLTVWQAMGDADGVGGDVQVQPVNHFPGNGALLQIAESRCQGTG